MHDCAFNKHLIMLGIPTTHDYPIKLRLSGYFKRFQLNDQLLINSQKPPSPNLDFFFNPTGLNEIILMPRLKYYESEQLVCSSNKFFPLKNLNSIKNTRLLLLLPLIVSVNEIRFIDFLHAVLNLL